MSIFSSFGGFPFGQFSDSNEDIRSIFFEGNVRKRRRPARKFKCKTSKLPLQVSLQQCFNGQLLKISHKRTRICHACGAKGGSSVQKCRKCKGYDQFVQMKQIGSGIYQQIQKICDVCKGQGEIIEESKKCKICMGNKVINQKKIIEIPLQRGSYDGLSYTGYGQGDQQPDTHPGDLIFVVQQKPHQIFTRVGTDLFMKKKITLVEALTGFEFQLKHLDGQTYNIYTGRGQIIADKQKKTVKGLGMPYFQSQTQFGNLVIIFQVAMPKKGELSNQQLEALSNLLPGKVNSRPLGEYEILEDFDKQGVNTSQEGGQKNMPQQQQEYQQESNCHTQ